MLKVEVVSVRCPKWQDNSHSSILCLVRTNTLSLEGPFSASPNDSEPHGREIYQRCLAGDFGPIEEASISTDPPHSGQINPESTPNLGGWPELPQFLLEANAENERGTVRGIVLVWGAMLEATLYKCIVEASPKPLSKAIQKLEFRPLGPKIDEARDLKLVRGEFVDFLKTIKEVRNAVAHNWDISLSNQVFCEKVLPNMRKLHTFFPNSVIVFHEDLEFLAKMVFTPAVANSVMHLAGGSAN